MAPSTASHVFISYSRRDSEAMGRVVAFLRDQGIKVWVDNEKLVPGTPIWEEEIEKAIDGAFAVIVVLSPEARRSDWVRREITLAEQHQKRLFPILVAGNENESIPLRLVTNQYVDFRTNESSATLALSNAISAYKVQLEVNNTTPRGLKPFQPAQAPMQRQVVNETAESRNVAVGRVPQRSSLKFAVFGVMGVCALAGAVGGLILYQGGQGSRIPEVPDQPNPVPYPTATATATAGPGIGSTMIGADSATLAYVSAAEFTMGSEYGSSNELPVHTVYLNAFWIDQTEVTNEMYAKCVNAGACESPSNIEHFSNPNYINHPVVFVDWNDANAYCSWAKRRLPTEAEWEKAASWDDVNQEKLLFPWGNSLNYDCSLGNFYDYTRNTACIGDTTPVKIYGNSKSPYGIYDTAGNVWEWVSSLFKPYPYTLNDGREYVSAPGERVIRGGSWKDYSYYDARSIIRYRADPGNSNDSIGFRCASSP